MPDGELLYESSSDGAFRQAEILTSVTQLKRSTSAATSGIKVDLVNHPFAIIVSQDCDLDLDFKARNGLAAPNGVIVGPEKMLPNILLCEVMTAQELKANDEINSPIWQRIKINEHIRYQFLQSAAASIDALGEGVPELAVDFKRYFTIVADDLYAQVNNPSDEDFGQIRRRFRLRTPYCEHFCTRFSYYLSRIALPEPHVSIST